MKDLFEKQKEFDRKHGWHWPDRDFDQKIDALKYSVIALAEEVGEIAGPVKKTLRRWEREEPKEEDLEILKDKVSEEVVDVFIYLMKLSTLLNMDLEEEYHKKMEHNKKKYEKYQL